MACSSDGHIGPNLCNITNYNSTVDKANVIVFGLSLCLLQGQRVSMTPKPSTRQSGLSHPNSFGKQSAPEQELDWLCDHFHDIFGQDDQPCPLTCAPWLVSAEEIAAQLSKTKIHKVVAPGTLPGIIIKSLAEPHARWLEAYLWSHWQRAPRVLACWKDARLTLLTKKKVLSPAEALGRPFCGHTCRRHETSCYLPCKSIQCSHIYHTVVTQKPCTAHQFCFEIRERCQEMRPGPWRPSAQTPQLGGGLILSMDLKQAYDRLPRQQLAEGLAFCGCPSSLQTVLLHWLDEAHYHLRHRGLSRSMRTSRGVRQGCRASPLEMEDLFDLGMSSNRDDHH